MTAPRVPPHDLTVEAALLGAALQNSSAVTDVAGSVSAEDFYKPSHGHVWQAIIELWARNEPTDIITVADHLKRSGLYDAVGGPSGMMDLQSSQGAPSKATAYARIIREHALLRRLLSVAGELAEIAYSKPLDVAAAADRAEQLLFDAVHGAGAVIDAGRDIADIMIDTLAHTEALAAGEVSPGLMTGLHILDDILGGLPNGELVLCGARPAMGKTQFATMLAIEVAKQGHPVLLVSAEMTGLQMGQRFLATAAQVDGTRLRSGHLLEQDWPKITDGVRNLSNLPITVMAVAAPGLNAIRSEARRLAARLGRPPLIVVDYLQILSAPEGENRNNEVSKLSWGLKTLALDLETVVFAASQLSRNLESRGDKRPMQSDLRDSGSLEQDAGIILFLYRDEVYHPDSPHKGVAEIIVAKNRHGKIGTAEVAYQAATGTFANMARM